MSDNDNGSVWGRIAEATHRNRIKNIAGLFTVVALGIAVGIASINNDEPNNANNAPAEEQKDQQLYRPLPTRSAPYDDMVPSTPPR